MPVCRLMVVILIFLLVAEILSIIGAALLALGSIIVACIFGGFLFLACIASIVVPFFVRDSSSGDVPTVGGLFKGSGGSSSGRPAAGFGLGLPPASEPNNQGNIPRSGNAGAGGGYGGGYGGAYNTSGGPNPNQGPGAPYAVY